MPCTLLSRSSIGRSPEDDNGCSFTHHFFAPYGTAAAYASYLSWITARAQQMSMNPGRTPHAWDIKVQSIAD